MIRWSIRLWLWGLTAVLGALLAAWFWWQGRIDPHEAVALASPPLPSPMSPKDAGLQWPPQLNLGARAAVSKVASVELEEALTATSPPWLIEASRKPPCSKSPEPKARSASAAERENRQAWQSTIEDLLSSPITDMRGAGLFISERADELVQESLQGHSPVMMEWAWAACQKMGLPIKPTNCAELSAQRLLDSGLGDPHFLLMVRLDEAVKSRDSVLVEHVLHELAERPPKAWALDRLPALAVTMWSPDMSNDLRVATARMAMMEWASLRLPSYQVLVQLCHPDVLSSKLGRRSACERVAKVMVDHGQNMIQVFIGLRIGELLGWPLAEIRARRLEVEAGGRHFSDSSKGPIGRRTLSKSSCEVVALQQRWAIAFAEKGETWFFRRLVKESGRSLESWARLITPYQPRPPASAPSDPL